jgi:hypothetical protein
MWARVKGQTENDLMKLSFRRVYAFRPGYIKPGRGLKNSLLFSKLMSPAYLVLHLLFPKYVCTLEDVGHAMIHVATGEYPDRVLENSDITRIARTEGAYDVHTAPQFIR